MEYLKKLLFGSATVGYEGNSTTLKESSTSGELSNFIDISELLLTPEEIESILSENQSSDLVLQQNSDRNNETSTGLDDINPNYKHSGCNTVSASSQNDDIVKKNVDFVHPSPSCSFTNASNEQNVVKSNVIYLNSIVSNRGYQPEKTSKINYLTVTQAVNYDFKPHNSYMNPLHLEYDILDLDLQIPATVIKTNEYDTKLMNNYSNAEIISIHSPIKCNDENDVISISSEEENTLEMNKTLSDENRLSTQDLEENALSNINLNQRNTDAENLTALENIDIISYVLRENSDSSVKDCFEKELEVLDNTLASQDIKRSNCDERNMTAKKQCILKTEKIEFISDILGVNYNNSLKDDFVQEIAALADNSELDNIIKDPYDSDSYNGYHSSDFEFLTESDAELDASLKYYKNKIISSVRCDDDAGPSYKDDKSVKKFIARMVETRENHEEPDEDQFLYLFGGPPVPAYSFEGDFKSLYSVQPTPMNIEYEGVGFDLGRERIVDEDEATRKEAEEVRILILQENLDENCSIIHLDKP